MEDQTSLPISGEAGVMRQERHIFTLRLGEQDPVKGILVSVSLGRKSAAGQNMLFAKLKRDKTGLSAALRKNIRRKIDAVGMSGVL